MTWKSRRISTRRVRKRLSTADNNFSSLGSGFLNLNQDTKQFFDDYFTNPTSHLKRITWDRHMNDQKAIKLVSIVSSISCWTDSKIVEEIELIGQESFVNITRELNKVTPFQVSLKMIDKIDLDYVKSFFSNIPITRHTFLDFLNHINVDISTESKDNYGRFILYSLYQRIGFIGGGAVGIYLNESLLLIKNALFLKKWKFDDLHPQFQDFINSKKLPIEDRTEMRIVNRLFGSRINKKDFSINQGIEEAMNNTEYGREIKIFLNERLADEGIGGQIKFALTELLFFGRFDVSCQLFISEEFEIKDSGRKYLIKWENPSFSFWLAIGSIVISIFAVFSWLK